MGKTVIKMGPCGGMGGAARDINVDGVERIIKVRIRHGSAIDAIMVFYDRNGHHEWSDSFGGTGGDLTEINLMPNEYFTSIEGRYGNYDGFLVIRSLTFVSNLSTYGPYGVEGGVPFYLPAVNGKIIGFHGRSGVYLDAIGTYVSNRKKNSSVWWRCLF
ncbi:jacalin-related lectin 19-like [Typha angustifolia]|uniref:jacalin-related lectin 19-like n=1 Tax=Typha angustifolia TaxID=59011 RepID=UPI003C3099A6